MKHTPGPWIITKSQRASLCEASIEISSKNGRFICDMGDYPNEADKANALLIASAPDLLTVAKSCLAYFEYMKAQNSNFTPDKKWLKPLKVAITRAEGKEES